MWESWAQARGDADKAEWERLRMLAAIVVQPHVKNRLTPQKLLPLPWDKPTGRKKQEVPVVSAEESKKRFERLAQG